MLTKKDLLEAIEDMPMDAPIMVCQVGGLMTEVADAVLGEIQFNNLKYKVIFIKTQITPKLC
jgi:hypothetical protein